MQGFKRIANVALVLCISMLIPVAGAAQFEEGRHYQVLETDKTDEPAITEFFSFYCQSCHLHQPFNAMLEERWPGILTKHHVSGLAPRNLGPSVQRAWAAAQILDVDAEFSAQMFERNFVERNQVASEQALAEVFSDLGVDASTLERTMSSFQVRTLSNRMTQLERRYQVSGTPTYIINGRYRMDNTAFRDSNDFFADYLALAEYLLAKP